jgi:fructokinase
VTALVIGEALIDRVTRDGETRDWPGGSPAHVAVGLSRLGIATTLLTDLGDDPDGAFLRAHLAASRVSLAAGAGPRPTSVARATIDSDGQASYDFDLTWELEPAALPRPSLLHFGSLAATLSPGAAQMTEIVAAHVGSCLISYDANCRPSLMGSPDRARPVIEAHVGRSTVVKMSDEDATWLYPDTPLDDVARYWLSLGPALVVVTLGAEGARAWTSGAGVTVPPAEGLPVVDTVGAGDALMAGLLYGLRDGLVQGNALARVLTQAGVVARRTCERPGADPPWLADLW